MFGCCGCLQLVDSARVWIYGLTLLSWRFCHPSLFIDSTIIILQGNYVLLSSFVQNFRNLVSPPTLFDVYGRKRRQMVDFARSTAAGLVWIGCILLEGFRNILVSLIHTQVNKVQRDLELGLGKQWKSVGGDTVSRRCCTLFPWQTWIWEVQVTSGNVLKCSGLRKLSMSGSRQSSRTILVQKDCKMLYVCPRQHMCSIKKVFSIWASLQRPSRDVLTASSLVA